MSKNKDAVPVDGSFLRTLQNYRKGEILTDLSDALRRVMEAVSSVKRAGEIKLTIKIQPNGDVYALTPEVTVKLPKEPKIAGLFYLDDNLNLVREDPNQTTLQLQALEGGQVEQTETAVAKQKYANSK